LLAGGNGSKNGNSSGDIRAAIERERERIARELHAGAGQPLSGVQINLEMVEAFLHAPDADSAARKRPAAEEALLRLRHLAGEASGQVRAVSHRLHPPEWQLLPLADAVRQLIDSSGLRQKFATAIHIGEITTDLDHQTKVALYRCAQECIANVIRHSGASHVKFELLCDGHSVCLRVSDDGKGFLPSAGGDGLGLSSIRRHAGSLGGECDIESGAAGTRITVRVPLSQESGED
jgi:signal transduction histidine kinase